MPAPKSKNVRTEDMISMSDRDHVIAKPGMYLDDISPSKGDIQVYDIKTKKIVKKNIVYSEGMIHLFVEVLSNAVDGTSLCVNKGFKSRTIEVETEDNSIRVRNYGIAISMDKMMANDGKKDYKITIAFSKSRSGSHLDNDNQTNSSGTHGMGVKLVNYFSKSFEVLVYDADLGQSFYQQWTDSAEHVSKAEIQEEDLGDMSFVDVIYELDLKRFSKDGLNPTTKGMTELLARKCFDTSFACGFPIKFNNTLFKVKDKEYIENYFELEPGHKPLIHEQDIVKKGKGKIASMRVIYLDTPGKGKAHCYCNNQYNKDGGEHCTAAYKQPLAEAKLLYPDVDLRILKSHLSVIVVIQLHVSAVYSSQSKPKLKDPKDLNFKYEGIVDAMKKQKWSLLHRIEAEVKFKGKSLKDITTKRGNHNITNVVHAYYCGKKGHFDKCTAWISEGKSADAYITFLMEHLEGREDYNGTYPGKGKPLNVLKNDEDKLAKHDGIISSVKRMLNLNEELDYSSEKNWETLNYGKVCISADQDIDGYHIRLLYILYFAIFFPSLFERGFVCYYTTPIIKARNKAMKTIAKFYSQQEYDDWAVDAPVHTVKYFKGLSCHKQEDVNEDYADNRIVTVEYDRKAREWIELAFGKKTANQRKKWIMEYAATLVDTSMEDLRSITNIIKEDLIQYSISTLTRCLPSLDGLKNCSRKIVYTTINTTWKAEKKTVTFGSDVGTFTHYHQGDKSMTDTISKMAQNFKGTLNLPLLQAEGNFGSPYDSTPGAPRYTFVKMPAYLPYIFRKEDAVLYKYVMDDNEKCEPKVLYPIIPLILVNQFSGIATGWNSYGPGHNVHQIIEVLKKYLTDAECETITLKPYFNKFNGTLITKLGTMKKKEDDEDEEDEEDSANSEELSCSEESEVEKSKKVKAKSHGAYVTATGTYRVSYKGKKTIVHIDELPPGMWGEAYIKRLKNAKEEKAIKEFRIIDKKNCKFDIEEPTFDISAESLGIVSQYTLNKMIVLNEQGIPTKFESAEDIMTEFFNWRLNAYFTRHDIESDNLNKEVAKLKRKLKFVEYVRDKKLIIGERSKDAIYKDMDNMKLDREFLKIGITSITTNGIEKIKEELRKQIEKRDAYLVMKPENIWYNELEQLQKHLPKDLSKTRKE